MEEKLFDKEPEQNQNASQITYDEDWQNVAVTEYPQPYRETETEKTEAPENASAAVYLKKIKKSGGKQILVLLQLFLCVLLCIAAFVIKSIGGEVYETVHGWYDRELNNVVIAEEDFQNFDIQKLIGSASSDEI